MINLSLLMSNSEINGPGGLFDFNATLPLVALQFILLMLILTSILYNPLITIIEERQEFILTSLNQASETLEKANSLTKQYKEELESVRKEAQLEITYSQNFYKEFLEMELTISKKSIDSLLSTVLDDLDKLQNSALENLDNDVQSLYDNIQNKLSI